jgi:hypothetical protein
MSENLPRDLEDVVRRLRSQRPELTPLELDQLARRVRSKAQQPAAASTFSKRLRGRLIALATLLVIGVAIGATVTATHGGTSIGLNASVSQYNSQCAGPGGTQGSYCAGNNLKSCANHCEGNNNSACTDHCYGNNNPACTQFCEGNNNPNCTHDCYGNNNKSCPGTQASKNCYPGQGSQFPGYQQYPPVCTGSQTPDNTFPNSCYVDVSNGASRPVLIYVRGRARALRGFV